MFNNFWQRISDKVFLSFVGSYLIGSWAIIQFVDWIVNRYNYAASWTDVFLSFFIFLLPGILMVAWRKTGTSTTNRFSIGILSVNILLATLISFFGFNSEVSAKPEKIRLTTDEGEEIVRMVPNQALTKRLVIFPFQGAGLDKWQALGWSMLQSLDIEQDNRISTYNGFHSYFQYLVKDYNYDLFDDIPFSIQRKISQDNLADYWTTCHIGDSIQYKVYSSNDGLEFMSKSYPKTDIYASMDDFTQSLEAALYNQEVFGKQKKIIDLPASELLNAKEDAVELYLKSKVASDLENDHTTAIELLENALKIDPNFALAHAQYGLEQFHVGNATASIPAIEKAMGLMAPLPERLQFNIKMGYYQFNNDVEKLIRLLKMWQKLYPSDYNPYERLFGYYQAIGKLDEANKVGEEALEAGHTGPMLLNLAELNIALSNLDKAEEYLKMYQATYPDKATDTKAFGELYLQQGAFDKAINFFEELTVLNPSDHSGYLYLADAYKKDGDFVKAEKTITTALRVSNTLQDTTGCYSKMESILAEQGKMSAAITLMEKRWALLRTIQPENSVGREIMYDFIVNRYKSIGRQEEVKEIITQMAKKIETNEMDLTCLFLINYHMAIEDGEAIKKSMEQCGDVIQTTSGDLIYTYVEGQRDMYLGNTKAAIPKLEMFVDSSGTGSTVMSELLLAKCYALDKQFGKAQNLYEKALKTQPNDANILSDYATCLKAANKTDAARKAVSKALIIWKDADPNFSDVVAARALLAEIGE